MPDDDVGQRAAQGVRVQGAVESHDERDVVGGARALDPVEEPQAPLREGQRHRAGRRCGTRAGRAGPVAVEDGGEGGDRGVLEEGAHVEFGAQRGPDPSDEPGGEQGVAAQGEEVVVHADPVHAQDVGEQPRQHLLVRRARGAARGAGQRGGGQGAAVELAVGVQRQRVEQDEDGRHHVGGQVRPTRRPSGVVRGGAGGRHDVGDETPVAGYVLADQDAGGAHGRVGEQGFSISAGSMRSRAA